jgi:hypothetical protein
MSGPASSSIDGNFVQLETGGIELTAAQIPDDIMKQFELAKLSFLNT